MKIDFYRQALSDTFKHLDSVIFPSTLFSSSKLLRFSGIKGESVVSFSAFDGVSYFEEKTPATFNTESFEYFLPIEILTKWIKNLPKVEQIFLTTTDGEEGNITLSHSTGQIKLSSVLKDYYKKESLEEESDMIITIPGDILKRNISSCMFITKESELNLTVKNDLEFFASQEYRMCYSRIKKEDFFVSKTPSLKISFVLNGKRLHKLCSQINPKENIKVSFGQKTISFVSENWKAILSAYNQDPPDISGILTSMYTEDFVSWKFNSSVLKDIFKRLYVIKSNSLFRNISEVFTDEKNIIFTSIEKTKTIQEQTTKPSEGEIKDLLVDTELLFEGIKAIGCEEVTITYRGNDKIISIEKDENCFNLLMPVKREGDEDED
jgi:DNA polymerase III sliding clamp (beta) subunit (PCNA family)